mgnify:CR=1 FL=1
MDMKSISQKLQDDIRAVMEANLHPNQQKIDVHEPEKDEITAHDFKKLRAMKKDQHGKVTKEDTDEPAWQTIGPSAIPINDSSPIPKEMTIEDIEKVKSDFKKDKFTLSKGHAAAAQRRA